MNPFDSFSGFCLSGKFYSRRAIVNSEFNTDNLLENEVEAIAFAAELFGDSPSITVETSGSTGSPKRIVFSKKAVITSAHATNRFFNLSSASIAVLPLPMRYIAGKMMVARAIAGGYNLMVRNPASNL